MSFKTVAIKDIGKLFDGPHATPPLANEGAIFLGIKNISEDGHLDFSEIRYVSEQDFPRWTRRVTPQNGDIVFTYEATLHRYAMIPEGFYGCLGRRVALLRPKSDCVDTHYLFYYFRSPTWKGKVEANVLVGATVDRIPIAKFPDFTLNVPPLPTQKRIADILSTYDRLIDNNNRRIALLEESIHLLYKEWFVRLRFPGYESVKVVDGIPDGWQRKSLKDIATLNYGKSLTKQDRKDGSIPVYGSSGIVGYHDKALVKGSGIIVGRKGNIGTVYWCPTSFYPIDTVYYIDSSEASFFLYHTLSNLSFISTDAAVPGLNRNYAYSFPLLIPTNNLRESFEALAIPIYKQIHCLQVCNNRLTTARDLLLPRLMNGSIAV